MIFNKKINNNKEKNNKKDYDDNDELKFLFVKREDETLRKINQVHVANSFRKRLIGLMFKKNIDYPLAFIIPRRINNRQRSSIHSIFMRFELTIVFVDEENIVFEIANLKPWKYYVPKKAAKYIIEFDKNKFNKSKLKIGDEIILK